jgi:hypothetical protein
VGDTVVWTVTEGINEPHSVTSGSPTDAATGSEFDSGLILKDNGDTFARPFENAGTFAYFCIVHPDTMKGSVVVLAAGESGTASQPPSAAPSVAASVGASGGASPLASPTAVEGGEAADTGPIDVTTKLGAAAILVAALVILFGWGALYRRMNPAPRA